MKAVLLSLSILAAGGAIWVTVEESGSDDAQVILNVSYDPTRALWRDLNKEFSEHYLQATGKRLTIKQSHGGSSAQATAVFSGLGADVVSLALWSDVDILRKHRLIKDGWEGAFDNHSAAYYSTIVFVVRKGNPKGIHDWSDLVKPGVKVITPNPKTSGNGRLSFLAAWGATLKKHGGSEEEARRFVTQVYRNVPVLDSGARGSTTTFARNRIGDVHLTWENEAHFELKEFAGELEIVYPSVSIKAEPPLAIVDRNVDRKGTRKVAEEYLKFVFTRQGQQIVAKHFFRPVDKDVLREHAKVFPERPVLFPITDLARDWDEVQEKFFSSGGVFDRIYQPE